MTAVFLTYSSNKVQLTLNDSNFQVNQKKVAVIRSSSYWELRANNQKMREKLVFKKLKMTDHLWLQKTKKKVKNRHNQDEKLPFSLKVREIDRWRLVKYYFKKVYVLHCRFSGWRTKIKAFPSIGNYTLFSC